jgi:hypothetical protein
MGSSELFLSKLEPGSSYKLFLPTLAGIKKITVTAQIFQRPELSAQSCLNLKKIPENLIYLGFIN